MTFFAQLVAGRRTRNWVAYALLAGLLVRALIPVGFMPGASGLEFCQGGMPSMAASMPAHHHHHAEGQQAPSHSTGHGEGCVFAGSAAGLAPPCVPSTAVPVQVATAYPVPSTSIDSSPTILRAQSPRGPPALS
ncbi:MAG: hypothetical protein NTZ79_06795 [Proteobacteria bacterium]|nr:hypothetical protein [Pseudomonadota bacterium]